MIFKTIEYRRETDHGKKLSLTASNDQVKKNKPEEFTMFVRKKGVFDATKFIKFKDDVARHQHNIFVKNMVILIAKLK